MSRKDSIKIIMPDDIDKIIANLGKKKKNPLDFLMKKLRSEEPAGYNFIFHNDGEFNEDEDVVENIFEIVKKQREY